MPESNSKKAVLEQASYRYNFDRMLYVHRGQRKAFSVEYIEDHTSEEIARRIAEVTPANEWTFYFSGPISEGVRRELQRVLER